MEQKNIQNHIQVHSEVIQNEVSAGYESLAVQNKNGEYELSVLVSGVHCAGCIQKIESSLLSKNNIKNSRLNFSTNRLVFSWDGVAEDANTYVHDIEKLGYGVKPYDVETQQSEIQVEERFLLLCLGVAGFAMGNIMLLSVGLWITSTETLGISTRDLMHFIQAFIGIPTIIYAGRPFFRSALRAL